MTTFPVPTPSQLLKIALHCHSIYGWTIIPCLDKTPRCYTWKHLQNNQTTSDIRQLFDRPDINGLGVLTGPASNGLVIRDYDKKSSYFDWIKTHAALAGKLPIVQSHRGYHVYMRGTPGWAKLLDGEYRGTSRQFTVIPPSIHPEGGIYEWLKKPGKTIPFVPDPVKAGFLLPGFTLEKNYKGKGKGKQRTPKLIGIPDEQEYIEDIDKVLAICAFAKRHQPWKVGVRNRCLLHYIRAIKGLLPDWTARQKLTCFHEWWRGAKEIVGTKDVAISLQEFFSAWELCHTPQKKMDVDLLRSRALKEPTPEKAEGLSDKLQLLARTCVHFQRISETPSFYLTWKLAASLAGMSNRWGQWAIKQLILKGVIRKLESGNNYLRKASSYSLI